MEKDTAKVQIYYLDEIINEKNNIENSIVNKWKKEETQGNIIIICTNKTVSFVEGMLSIVQLNNPIIIAENGGIIQMGTNNPPKVYHRFDIDKEIECTIKDLKYKMSSELENLWFQDNEIGIMVYYEEEIEIRQFLDKQDLDELQVIWGEKSISIMPLNINYLSAIEWVKNNICQNLEVL